MCTKIKSNFSRSIYKTTCVTDDYFSWTEIQTARKKNRRNFLRFVFAFGVRRQLCVCMCVYIVIGHKHCTHFFFVVYKIVEKSLYTR